jgi:hypothetical protein
MKPNMLTREVLVAGARLVSFGEAEAEVKG